MDKQTISDGLKFAWDGQEFGQKLIDYSTTEREYNLGAACKEAFRFLYLLFLDERRKEKQSVKETIK